jgi:hypothetical protein
MKNRLLVVSVCCFCVLCCAVLCCAVLCCAVLGCAVLCCSVLCCAVLFCAWCSLLRCCCYCHLPLPISPQSQCCKICYTTPTRSNPTPALLLRLITLLLRTQKRAKVRLSGGRAVQCRAVPCFLYVSGAHGSTAPHPPCNRIACSISWSRPTFAHRGYAHN